MTFCFEWFTFFILNGVTVKTVELTNLVAPA